jgi:hypothetical protein
MRKVNYTDSAGRKFVVLVRDQDPDSKASSGIRLGPPDLSFLGLPIDVEIRLNNQLFARGMIEVPKLDEVQYALQAALKVSAQEIAALYQGAPGEIVVG